MRTLLRPVHALSRRQFATHHHKPALLQQITPNRLSRIGAGGMSSKASTTQVSEFAQRQLLEGVIDFAAGQVSLNSFFLLSQ